MSGNAINQKIAIHFNQRGENYSNAWMPIAKQHLSSLEIDFIHEVIMRKIEELNGKTIRTLDIGIGTGRISEAILKNNVEHYGTDISETMVNYCKSKFKSSKKVKQFMVHDIADPIPESWGKFDIVTAIRVLSYTPLWRKMLINIYKTMNQGGIFIFTFPNKHSSMLLSSLLWKRRHSIGSEMVSEKELIMAIKESGFSKYQISGLNKLLDTVYDLCNDKISANILFKTEIILKKLFGQKFLTREFYVKCKK